MTASLLSLFAGQLAPRWNRPTSSELMSTSADDQSGLVTTPPAGDVALAPQAEVPVASAPVALPAAGPAPETNSAAPRHTVLAEYQTRHQTGWRVWLRELVHDSPSWLGSLLVHMVLLIAFGLWALPPAPELVIAALDVKPSQREELEIEEPVEFDPQPLELEEEALEFEEQPDTPLVEEVTSFSPADDLEAAASSVEIFEFGSNVAPMTFMESAQGFDGSALAGRGHASRKALVRKGGGNEASETAVRLALEWLARHQNPNTGTWSFDHRHGPCQGRCRNPGSLQTSYQGATGLALLPYLGAGQTHTVGDFQPHVARGLAALVELMKVDRKGGSLMDGGTMYSHGIGSIALCEAYAMSDDPSLRGPAQLALDFISYAQDPVGGGWRYRPRTQGDTSVVGWQVMALKSGHMAYLSVPYETVYKANAFLDSVAYDGGAGYIYFDKPEYRRGTSAVGLLCRMYLGWKKDNQTLQRGVERLAQSGPSETDYYMNYYATQVLFQFTGAEGPLWEKWNTAMRDQLVAQQDKEGHERGSWYVGSSHSNESGGRLYMTAMATMTLEVYYRHMPIYRAESVESEFPE